MPVDTAAEIHPTSIVEPGASLGEGVRVGPYCVVGAEVVLGARVWLKSHCVVTGSTVVGEDTVIFPFASIGEIPQDLKYRGEKTRLKVGKRNRIREGVTMNTGTRLGGGVTSVGDDCLFMTGAHVGHDARIGNSVVVANQSAIGGHCVIEDHVIIGGLSGIHQRVRIGQGAIIGAVVLVARDVIPFGFVQGPGATLGGLNIIGLKRRCVARADIDELRKAYRILASAGEQTLEDRVAHIDDAFQGNSFVNQIVEFVREGSERSLLPPSRI